MKWCLNILRATGNFFFSCDSTSANKNAKSGKNHQKMDVARLGFRKTNVGARKSRISNIRLYHRILYVSKICLPGLHGFPNKVGVQEKKSLGQSVEQERVGST